MDELERALEYRREAEARARYHLEAERNMAGSPEARRRLAEAWAPVLPWAGWDPPDLVAKDPK